MDIAIDQNSNLYINNFWITINKNNDLDSVYIEKNKETIMHNITSIYEKLLFLKENNDVIDLTYNELYSGNEYENFEKDLYFFQMHSPVVENKADVVDTIIKI